MEARYFWRLLRSGWRKHRALVMAAAAGVFFVGGQRGVAGRGDGTAGAGVRLCRIEGSLGWRGAYPGLARIRAAVTLPLVPLFFRNPGPRATTTIIGAPGSADVLPA